MKKLFLLLVMILTFIGCRTKSSVVPVATVSGDLSSYNYVYVIPTSGVTSGSGGGVYTVNPSELITGYLMKKGYSPVPSIVPDLAERTLIVAYGNTGTSSIFVAQSGVIIQFRDAKTHQMVASSEAKGTSVENETNAITYAIYKALDNIFAANITK